MYPDAVIVEDLRVLLTFLVGLLFLLAYYIWYLSGRIDDGCPACPHCARRRKEAADADAKAEAERVRRFGVRSDEPAEAPESSDGEDGGPGPSDKV